MLHNETVRNLMDLGLTLVQTRTYLALCKSESATAKAISKTANLARQDVYRVMPTLEKLGLVERIFDAPTRYRAIPVKRGIKNMLNNRIREHNELHKKTTELLKSLSNLPQEPEPTGSPEEDQQFVLTSEVNLLFERLAEETRTTQENIDLAGNWETNENALLYCLEEFKRALERSVKIRVVMEKPENEKLIPALIVQHHSFRLEDGRVHGFQIVGDDGCELHLRHNVFL